MNVVIVSDRGLITGGMEKTVVTTAIGLADRGHKVGLFCGYAPLDPLLVDDKRLVTHCMGYQDPPPRSYVKLRVLGNDEAAAALAEFLKEFPPRETVIHVHDVHMMLSWKVFNVVFDLGYRVVMSIHNYAMACPNVGFFHYPKNEVCTLRGLSLPCLTTQCTQGDWTSKVWTSARGFMIRHRAQMPQRLRNIICVSRFSHSKFEGYFHPDATVDILPCPVDIEASTPVAVERNSEFVYVGRLSREKNPVLYARAAFELGVPVTFVGEGEERENVLKANPNAQITGWLRPEEVPAHLERARALGMVSLWYEGMPIVVMDAMAKGLPILVSDACASQEAIDDGVSGFVFRSDDVEDLKDRMRRLLDDETARKMGQASYAKYWSNPQTLDVHLENLERIYGRMLDSQK